MAVEAMQLGAYDFLEKPFDPDRMTDLARKATQSRRLTLDNRALRTELSGGGRHHGASDGHLAAHGEIEGGHPRSRPGGRPRPDRGRDRHGQDPDGARPARRGIAGARQVPPAVVQRVRRGHADRPAVRRHPGRPAGGRRGPWRHARARGRRGAVAPAPGPAAHLHQRAGRAARDAHRRHLQPPGRGPDLRGRAPPGPLLPPGGPQDHLSAAAPARRGHPDAVHPAVRAVRRRVRLRQPPR